MCYFHSRTRFMLVVFCPKLYYRYSISKDKFTAWISTECRFENLTVYAMSVGTSEISPNTVHIHAPQLLLARTFLSVLLPAPRIYGKVEFIFHVWCVLFSKRLSYCSVLAVAPLLLSFVYMFLLPRKFFLLLSPFFPAFVMLGCHLLSMDYFPSSFNPSFWMYSLYCIFCTHLLGLEAEVSTKWNKLRPCKIVLNCVHPMFLPHPLWQQSKITRSGTSRFSLYYVPA